MLTKSARLYFPSQCGWGAFAFRALETNLLGALLTSFRLHLPRYPVYTTWGKGKCTGWDLTCHLSKYT